ncbi:Type I Iterative PKS [Emmonsiellopsis sp. PD_5]|nr:Type I Iterative PKS [Emmonsiellopsis sp. PD_5]
MGSIDISEEGHPHTSATRHPPVNNSISEPVAIVGYACRLPGHVSSPTDLWELCTRRRSGWSPIPPDRFSSEAYRHPYASKTGTFNPAGGYFLQEDISRFDAPFFNITLQEAQSMDPQQRLLLECSFEALESAGIPRDIYSGQNVGVFIGGNLADYEVNNVRDVETIPILTVDTACSSSLVALHYAVQSLRNGESATAIVGGCRLNVLPDTFVSMLFNDEGRTFAFDERAQSGFARGEGVGMVVLKPLNVALRDGDPIRAIIANTGVNQDGKTQGITQPSGQAQESLIRHVYKTANLDVNDCGFAEMHGTGTKVGDPIEAMAVYRALAQHRSPRDPLYIGSVKSNVGHLEGASGIISVIKAAMMLENDLILPNIDFKKPNKNIPLNKWNMKVPPSTRPWPQGKNSGEISAAYAAGAYNLKSAMTLTYHHGQMTLLLKQRYPSLKGTMLAVRTGQDMVHPILKLLQAGYATITCINSPSSITISGDCLAIEELESILQEKQLFCQRLKIDVAYHSDHMNKISEDYLSSIKLIHPEPLKNATFYSSVLGCLVKSTELSLEYWVKNLTSPILFPHAIGEMCSRKSPPHLLFKIGLHSALKGPIIDTLKNLGAAATKILYASTIVRGADAMESILNSAATTYQQGVNLDMNAVNSPCTNAHHNSIVRDLPSYPWQHGTQYWHKPHIALKHRTRDGKRNDMLGVLANYSNDMEPTWRNIVHLDEVPWLHDHKMQGLPLSMAIKATQRRTDTRGISFSGFELREVVANSALVLGDDSDVETTISVRPYSDSSRAYSASWDEFKVSSWAAERGWTEHCRGLIRVHNKKAPVISSLSEMEIHHRQVRMANVKMASTQSISSDELYQALKNLGADYGPPFQGVERCFADCQHSHAEIHVRNTKSVMPKGFEPDLIVHPAFLDGFLQLAWPILGPGRVETTTFYMPTSIQRVYIDLKTPRLPGERAEAFCEGGMRQAIPEPTRFDIFSTAHDSNEILVSVEGLIMTPIRDAKIGSDDRLRKLCYRFEWQPLVTSNASTNWLLTAENRTGMNGLGVGRGECASSTDEKFVLNGQIPQDDAETPAINGNGIHSHHATNGHASPLSKHPLSCETSSVNGSHVNSHAESETVAFHMAVFGAPNDVATQLCEVITTIAPQSTIHALEDVECSGKDVIILETGTSSLRNLTPSLFNSLKRTLLTASSVLWVYREDMPDAQMSVGLARSVRSETMAKISTLGIDAGNLSVAAISIIDTINALWPSEGIPCEEREFKSDGSGILVPRVVEDDTANSFIRNETENMSTFTQPYAQTGRRFKLQIENPGSLDSLFFTDDIPSPLAENEVEIEVKATGVNFKDVVVCMGHLSQPYIGIECSGIVSSVGSNVKTVKVGQRVMAMSGGGYSTYARCLETSLYPIPADLSFEEAAAMPVVFCTAYYGLFDLARLQRGERVLIYAGAGGVGQAAIKLSQMAGAEIYVTVGSDEKRAFLMQRYSIPSERILCSRDASFASGIRILTNNEGVDVVLNSLAGELLRETWNCLAPFGRFIEIGKADITRNTGLEMSQFEHNVMFASVDLTKVAKQRPQLMRRILNDISRLTSDGLIRPISPIATHPVSEIEVALRTLQAGKNIGKLVVVPQANDQVKVWTI